MADYYPLLARALDALPDRTPAMRKAVYERARNALIGQLRSLDPPLPEADIDLERQALDNAIERLERDYGASSAAPEPAPPPVVSPRAAPAPVPPARPAPIPEPPAPPPAQAFEPAPPPERISPPEPPPPPEPTPFLPPAPPPSFLPLPPEEPREAPVPITARKAKVPDPVPEAQLETVAPAEVANDAIAANDSANGRQRPRIDVVAPRGGRSRLLRNAFVGVVLTVVIGLIAVAAFLLRDKPANLPAGGAETAETQQDPGDTKYSDRVGGDLAPKASPSANAPATASSSPRNPSTQPSQPGLAVAQRAVLIEENTATPNAAPISTAGRVVWRLDSVPGEQGQPLETAIVATVTVPEAGLTLVMTIQRNLDQTLPASHTINLVFTDTGTEGEKRAVQDIGLLQAKDDEAARGSPVSGLPIRVTDNRFLIGLSSLRGDVDRNTDLLLHKPWFDLAVRYVSGQRAVVNFEKGNAGTQVVQDAFDQWK
ncbi:histidine kinase [Methylobacterium sp. WL120]|uniref:histidine kinase n=1 Tax=Methylobacterium sp. WL120 TaxID=2603887 RepID=UPI0011CC4DC7|nr:histidine kinase [Methylobacterium sp. WL120]TXM67834.1 histidine kinase [Methylobacterium sp. WL120]